MASTRFDDETLRNNGRCSYLESEKARALLSLAERKLLNAADQLDPGL